jgi:adenylosuccinate synthase
MIMEGNNTTIVTGGHFGDEGKGKVISYLAQKDKPAIVARAGVGPNAGHTIYKNGKEYGLRMVPCGFVNESSKLFIGAGVLVDTKCFLDEVKVTGTEGRIFLDKRCAIIEQKHKDLDSGNKYLKEKVGTTGSGCGPANQERAGRTIKLAQEIPELSSYLIDVPLEVNTAISAGKKVIIEASQGFGLSLFYGTYPFVTSKDTSASMAACDIGVGPTRIKEVIVVYKAYTTRVGAGPMEHFVDEQNIKDYPIWQEILKEAKAKGHTGTVNEALAKHLGEKGTVTGRARRVGDFDYELAKYSAMINGATQLCITCLDKMFPECKDVTSYDKLSARAKEHISRIEKSIGVKVTMISTGPKAEDMVDLRK